MADEFVVDNSVFISVDTTKIGAFIDQCPDLITEFEAIKTKFNDINTTLLTDWEGEGADEYKKESDHILEKIGDLGSVLNEITGGTIKDLRDAFSGFDDEMQAFNENPGGEES